LPLTSKSWAIADRPDLSIWHFPIGWPGTLNAMQNGMFPKAIEYPAALASWQQNLVTSELTDIRQPDSLSSCAATKLGAG
jgi:hypothetical protein